MPKLGYGLVNVRWRAIGIFFGCLVVVHFLAEARNFTAGLVNRSRGARTVYRTADDYLPHFQKVVRLQGMTMNTSRSTCRFKNPSQVNFQFGEDRDWKVKLWSDEAINKTRNEWRRFVQEGMIPYRSVADRFHGRGIVVTAGNDLTLFRLQVVLRALTLHGSMIPVEVHYWAEELNAANKTILTAIYPKISFMDLSDKSNIIKSEYNTMFPVNYNLKVASLLNSRFAEPILLDSDNVPVADPSLLYESKTYKTFGTVFYPDIARTRPENPIWAITNTMCRDDEYEQESGQLVIDKSRFWYHLQLANYFATTDGYMNFILGDKDCFRFAWHALRTPYGTPDRWITSIGFVGRPDSEPAFPAIDEPARTPAEVNMGGMKSVYCGHTFGQHHPDGQNAPILFLHGGLLKTLSKQMIQHVRKQGGGLFTAYKRSERANNDHRYIENVHIRYNTGEVYLPPNLVGHAAQCTDYELVPPGLIGDTETFELGIIENFFAQAGGYWMLDMEQDTF